MSFFFFFPLICFVYIIHQTSSQTTRDDYLNLFYTQYPTPKNITMLVKSIVDYFTSINNEDYVEIFSSSEKYSRFYYSTAPSILMKNYIIAFFNQDNFQIHIIINPCVNYDQYCCESLAECIEENIEIQSKKDLEIAYIANNFLPLCENEFSDICGTFLEIHMPGNELILEKKQIPNYVSSGYTTLFLSTKKLCSGKYEIWMVMRIRGNNYLIYTKLFYVKYPSCTCEDILYHGYKCLS